MTAAIKVGDLVRPKLIMAGKHLWVVIGEETQITSISGPWATIRYLTIAHGSNKMQLYEKDLKKVSE
tara:strand:- start:32 stop:232 length:201 start_codon:yes stop_codon:yes gene_type:complete